MDKWSEQLSEYIDGGLAQPDAEALEAHLLECAECGQALQQLRAVVFRATQVIDRPPENDLWGGIAARIAEPAPAIAAAPRAPSRRVSFSIPQLVAASIVLMLLSGGSMFVLLQRSPAGPVAGVAPATGNAPVVAQAARASAPQPVTTREAVSRPVSVKSPAAENYNAAITELEGALRDGRAHLDTATVRVLETNLHTIDGAINEARSALGRDPGNPYLNRYLDETMQKKIQLLRRATGILRAQT
ncbi:MAG TPA: zf-HC2 domain-containing protein [Longimicrobiales bacterium]